MHSIETAIYSGWILTAEKVNNIFTEEDIKTLIENSYLTSLNESQYILGTLLITASLGQAKPLGEDTYITYQEEIDEMIKFIHDLLPADKQFFFYPEFYLVNRAW